MKTFLIALAVMAAYLTPDRKIHNLGEVEAGAEVTDTIRFRNTGEEELVVYHVVPDCNCTTADYTKTPISPGKEGMIVVKYKSPEYGRGRFRHSIRIRSNAENAREIVYLEGVALQNNK